MFTISRLKGKYIDLSIDFYVVSYKLDLLYSQFCFVICQSLIGLSFRLTPPQSVTLSQTQFNAGCKHCAADLDSTKKIYFYIYYFLLDIHSIFNGAGGMISHVQRLLCHI